MQFDQIVAPTIKELFEDRIVGMILSGRLAVGDRLPTEREMSEKMGISKTVVHAGVKELARKGFLRVADRKGIYVADYIRHGNIETLTTIMNLNGGRLDEKNVRSILEVRLQIELPAIREAARRRTESDMGTLRAAAEEAEAICVEGSPPDYAALALRLYRFHHAIFVMSGNTITPLIFDAFKPLSLAFWESSARATGPALAVEKLKTLAALIGEGDGEGAAAYLEKMIRSFATLEKE